jgi:hypothetical protein
MWLVAASGSGAEVAFDPPLTMYAPPAPAATQIAAITPTVALLISMGLLLLGHWHSKGRARRDRSIFGQITVWSGPIMPPFGDHSPCRRAFSPHRRVTASERQLS